MSNKVELTPMQIKAIEHVGKNALVSASAGSGKTHVVIERIIKLITEKNVSVKNVLAVTFTKLAAQEMKEKLLTALTKKYIETKNKRLKEEIESVNSSDIVTIDSFSQKLVKKHFYVLGVDPNFEILDETRGKVLQETAIENLFEKLYIEKNQEFLKIVPIFSGNRNDDNLKGVVKKLYEYSVDEGGIDVVLDKTTNTFANIFDYIAKEFEQKIKTLAFDYSLEFKDVANSFSVDTKRKEYALMLYEICENLYKTTDYYKFFNDYVKIPLNLPSGKYKEESSSLRLAEVVNKFKGDIETFVKFYAIDKEEEEERLKSSLEIIKSLFNVIKLYEKEYERLKSEENVLSFSDIEILALKLLQNEEILNEVKNSYEHIFVDEYQDVNAIQESLINSLERDNLFLVGDSKQSIYAFRGCNPAYFSNKYDRYLKGDGEAIPLDNNFRSAKSIIGLVNAVFKKVMTKDFGGYDYFNNEMIYGNLYKDNLGVAKVHVINKAETKKEESKGFQSRVYSVKNGTDLVKKVETSAEAKLIVKLVTDALNSTYYDIKEKDESKRTKKVEYKDIAILLRSVSLKSKLFCDLLDSLIALGLPVSSTGERKIKNYPEIKVLTSLVSLLVCADRDIPLATVMLSLFDFTEEELKTIKESYCKSSNTSFYTSVVKCSETQTKLGKKCLNFVDWLNEKRLIAEFLSADVVLLDIVNETGFLAKLTASKYGDIRVKRVERFISESSSNGKKVRISELESNLENVLEDLSVVEDGGENTIKIMTMHASKGLEFPVVIVGGTNKKFNTKDTIESVVKDKNLGVAIKSYNDEDMTCSSNNVLNFLKYKLIRASADEELRLFYVALTRAKYQLHVTVYDEDLDKEIDYERATCMADFLHKVDLEKVYYEEDELESIAEDVGESVAGGDANENLTEKIVKNLSYVYPFNDEKTLPVKSSVTDANKGHEQEYYKTTSEFGFSSSEKGTIYHKIFELIDFYNYSEQDIENFIQKGIITKEQAKLVDPYKIQRILSLDIFKEIKQSKLYKERKFCKLVPACELRDTLSKEPVLIQGIIDLIAVDKDGAILIDYKISTIESEEDIVKAYSTQMRLYKQAIEDILKVKVKKVLLINVLQEKVIEV